MATDTPLKGDGSGQFRIQIVGNSGTGKSTLGKHLSDALGVPYVGLDTIAWQPGWAMRTRDDFQDKLIEVISRAPEGWVIDGNFTRLTGDIIDTRATDIIWLDPPLVLYLPRIIWRTLLRLLRLRAPCSPGCFERASETFSRDSIILYALMHHRACRERYSPQLVADKVENGGLGRMRRIGGWGADLRVWLNAVKEMLRNV